MSEEMDYEIYTVPQNAGRETVRFIVENYEPFVIATGTYENVKDVTEMIEQDVVVRKVGVGIEKVLSTLFDEEEEDSEFIPTDEYEVGDWVYAENELRTMFGEIGIGMDEKETIFRSSEYHHPHADAMETIQRVPREDGVDVKVDIGVSQEWYGTYWKDGPDGRPVVSVSNSDCTKVNLDWVERVKKFEVVEGHGLKFFEEKECSCDNCQCQ